MLSPARVLGYLTLPATLLAGVGVIAAYESARLALELWKQAHPA